MEEFKREMKTLTVRLKEAENRAEQAEKQVKRLQKEVDRLEGAYSPAPAALCTGPWVTIIDTVASTILCRCCCCCQVKIFVTVKYCLYIEIDWRKDPSRFLYILPTVLI